MKFLIKQPAALIILLLVGYSQVFLHLHRVDFSPAIKAKRSHHIEVPAAKTIEIGGDYFESDNKRNLLKTFSRSDVGADIFYGHIPAEFFFRSVTIASFFGERFSRLPVSGASLFRVLRL